MAALGLLRGARAIARRLGRGRFGRDGDITSGKSLRTTIDIAGDLGADPAADALGDPGADDSFDPSDVHPQRRSLAVTGALLDLLGNPHLGTPTIHVAGTKGKGSVCALCANALRRQGYRTGLLTGPRLHTWREDIRVDGQPIPNAAAAALVDRFEAPFAEVLKQPEVEFFRAFELMVVMGLTHFRDMGTEFNVVEVGIGGLKDATNVVEPSVSVITSIGLDHTEFLGETVEEVAAHKAGIIKPGRPVVTASQLPSVMEVIRATAKAMGAPLIEVGRDVRWEAGGVRWPRGSRAAAGQEVTVVGRRATYELCLPLLGDYQLENAATAVAALEVLQEQGHTISAEAIAEGFETTEWPCRLEVLDRGTAGPLVIADGAHNPLAAGRLREALPRYFAYDKVVVLMNVYANKDREGVIAELAQLRPEVVVTRSRSPRGSSPKLLAELWQRHGVRARVVRDPAVALALARVMAGARGVVVATGSFTVAARTRELVKRITPELELAF